jgi:virginiamycin B lyase
VTLECTPSRFPYGIPADHQNNLYLMDFAGEQIARVDAKTGVITAYKTPTPTRSRAAAGSMRRIGCGLPNMAAAPSGYSIRPRKGSPNGLWRRRGVRPTTMPDAHGEVWAGGMFTDRVARLDPRAGEITECLMPRTTNMRRIWADRTTTPPTFWTGSNHAASTVKVEPLD